jgi:hypothetical protein
VIYVPSFIKIDSGVKKGEKHRQQRDLISLLLFLQNRGSRLKMKSPCASLVKPYDMTYGGVEV